jgi:hypothetical protein
MTCSRNQGNPFKSIPNKIMKLGSNNIILNDKKKLIKKATNKKT